MGGGGGSTPEPKKFISPPLDESPAKNPIPNWFAPQQRSVLSPYEIMAAMYPVKQDIPFGATPPPVQFTTPERRIIETLLPQLAQPAPPSTATTRPSTMTKEEYLARGGRLGKGGGV